MIHVLMMVSRLKASKNENNLYYFFFQITEPYSSNGGNESSIEESGNKESSIEQNNGPAVEAENENQDDIVKLSRKLPAELKIHISESERHIENFVSTII